MRTGFSRATGAYRFVIIHGRDTVVDVQSKSICARDKVGKLGVAPWQYVPVGPNQPSPTTNYRPGLHDSNGYPFMRR